MEGREWGAQGKGTRRTRGGPPHQSCVWWREIRDRIARGDCSLPKGCVCVCVLMGWVGGGVSSSGSLAGGCIPCLWCTLWPLPARIGAYSLYIVYFVAHCTDWTVKAHTVWHPLSSLDEEQSVTHFVNYNTKTTNKTRLDRIRAIK